METNYRVLVGGRAETLRGSRRVIPGISQKVLTEQLRELGGDGIVKRQPKGSVPSPVEYSLTDYGQSVLPLVEDVRLWGRAHLERLTSQTDEPST